MIFFVMEDSRSLSLGLIPNKYVERKTKEGMLRTERTKLHSVFSICDFMATAMMLLINSMIIAGTTNDTKYSLIEKPS